MGIQAHFKKSDLQSAGVIVDIFEEKLCCIDEEGDNDERISYSAKLTFPDRFTWIVTAFDYESDDLCVDFNEWGTNKKLLKPRFESLGIKWMES
jgi:hypothetical protein